MATRSNATSGGSAVSTGETPVFRPPAAANEDIANVFQATIFFAISPLDRQLTWNSDRTLVHMLTDLVKASGGTVTTEADGILSATTGTALQALVLGVRAVRLATSYARYRPEGIDAFTVAIMSAPETGVSPEAAVRQLLTAGGPGGRILLAGEALNQLRNLPGLQARKVTTPNSQKVEIHELILPAITPDTKTAEIVAMDPAPVRQPTLTEPTRVMAAIVPRDVEVEEPTRSGISKTLLIGGLAAVLVLGGVLLKVMGSRSTPAAATVPAVTATAAAPVTAPTPAAIQPLAPPPQVQPPSRPVRAAAEPPAAPKTRAKVADEPTAAPKAAESDGPHGGFTADQLKAILDKADKLTANGKYEEAIRNYNVVLAADPGNGRAKAGKERAVTNMNMP